MQELLLEQPNNKRQENVIEHVVDLLAEVCRDSQAMAVMSDTTFDLMLACLKFLLEAVQGNSARNKNYLATEDAALNATHQILIWVWTASRQRWELSALAEVQLLVFQLLAALMEGQNDEADRAVVKHLSKRYDSVFDELRHHERAVALTKRLIEVEVKFSSTPPRPASATRTRAAACWIARASCAISISSWRPWTRRRSRTWRISWRRSACGRAACRKSRRSSTLGARGVCAK